MPYELCDDTSEEREMVNKIREQIIIGGCKIGGYPRYLQDDPRLYSERVRQIIGRMGYSAFPIR